MNVNHIWNNQLTQEEDMLDGHLGTELVGDELTIVSGGSKLPPFPNNHSYLPGGVAPYKTVLGPNGDGDWGAPDR